MANVNNRVPMGYVSEDFVKQRVMNRKQFYEGFIRNNYWTPKYEFCTRKWMLAVLEKEAYCPKHGIRAK